MLFAKFPASLLGVVLKNLKRTKQQTCTNKGKKDTCTIVARKKRKLKPGLVALFNSWYRKRSSIIFTAPRPTGNVNIDCTASQVSYS